MLYLTKNERKIKNSHPLCLNCFRVNCLPKNTIIRPCLIIRQLAVISTRDLDPLALRHRLSPILLLTYSPFIICIISYTGINCKCFFKFFCKNFKIKIQLTHHIYNNQIYTNYNYLFLCILLKRTPNFSFSDIVRSKSTSSIVLAYSLGYSSILKTKPPRQQKPK